MNNARLLSAVLAATLCAGSLALPALAASPESKEQNAMMNSPTTLSQAIATAERQTGGKAYDAGVDVAHGKPRIVVETNGPKGVQTLTVDAGNGQVIGTRAGGVVD